eukprot:SAG31_NODE_2930_length_4898_cov_3.710356_4_plen_63_part_00
MYACVGLAGYSRAPVNNKRAGCDSAAAALLLLPTAGVLKCAENLRDLSNYRLPVLPFAWQKL